MVRITKPMQPKHFETLSPYLKEFRSTACSIALPHLPRHLASFPTTWPFPRGDLYHWTPLLNRFDTILENFCRTYKLDEGPQTRDFGCKVLVEPGETSDTPNLAELGYGSDGDRELVESILAFSRMLLQNCGNRSLYASSAHLNSLLNSTSLSLLEVTLSLGSELAQRYLAAFKRQSVSSRQPNNPQLLQNHYNINLTRVQQLALPFTKTVVVPFEPAQSVAPVTPSTKGKDKATFNTPTSQRSSTTTVRASDLVSMAKGGSGVSSKTSSPKTLRNSIDGKPTEAETSWAEWGDVKVTYYPKPTNDTELGPTSSPSQPSHGTLPNQPVTPTPVRRTSNLGPHAQRQGRGTGTGADDSPTAARSSGSQAEETLRPNFKTIEISSAELKSAGVHSVLEDHIAGLPQELQYELLTKLRVADALTSSLESRRQILAVRLLAITNLSYIHLEAAFAEKVMKHDSDEPRRLQLIYQLAELVHPPAEGDPPVPLSLQTIAFSTLDALSQHPSKYNDVCSALSTNVSHGVLLYVIRKAVAGMAEESTSTRVTEEDEWREALFSLLSDISMMPRAGGELITAGLMPILVEILGQRTSVAERYQPKVLGFLDNIMYSARDAFQTLVNANGLQAISDLIVYEVTKASENVAQGNGMRPEYRSAAVDYEIPYFQQQTLKWLFKFIHHMMTTAGGYGGNFDRLLRNLIDSSQLLGGLREIISNGQRFGSVVWTHAVSILNDFINNEPTSFAVIAEAGLSRALLESVTCNTITMPSESKSAESQAEQSTGEPAPDRSSAADHTDDEDGEDDDDDTSDDEFRPQPRRPTKAILQASREGPLAKGIMPTAETIGIIPQAFGAICLNNSGMKMFLASDALDSFFEIFESPEHVKCMNVNKELPSNLGGSFDELVRHHPPLKTAIMNAILDMVARVSHLCKTKAEKNHLGAVLRIYDAAGKPVVAGAESKESPGKGKTKAVDDGDVEMEDADADATTVAPESEDSPDPSAMTPYVATVATFLSAIFGNTSVRAEFCIRGGIEYVLDLADSPCLAHDFTDASASRILHSVIATLAEQKPHLTMPSLLHRAQSAADALAPFAKYHGPRPFFKPFVNREAQKSADPELLAQGTKFAKALVNVNTLALTLHACLHHSAYTHRSVVNSLTQLNLADYYAQLVNTLGPLLGACFREEFSIDKAVPDSFEHSVRARGSSITDSLFAGLLGETEAPTHVPEPADAQPSASASQPADGPSTTPAATESPALGVSKPKQLTATEMEAPEFKNYQVLRYLLKKMSRTISPFFQILGKGLVPKRSSTDAFQKQGLATIADALAETVLNELSSREDESSMEYVGHCVGMIRVVKDMLIDISRHSDRPVQVIALVLQSFKNKGGFAATNHILESFAAKIRPTSNPSDTLDLDRPVEDAIRSEMAIVIVKEILGIYNQVVNGKNVTESIYTASLQPPRDSRDRTRPDYFSQDQFLVELRMAVLPVVRRLWESNLPERAPSEISEKLIDVIRTIATADNENNAFKRSDKPASTAKPARKLFKVSSEHITSLVENGYDTELAQEALYRCNNSLPYALEYCNEIKQEGRRRNPIPEGDVASSQEQSSSRPRTVTSTGTATPDDHPMAPDDVLANAPAILESLNEQLPPVAATEPLTAPHLAELLLPGTTAAPSTSRASPSSVPQQSTPAEEIQVKQVTVDDLNEERAAIRTDLIDKCLEVINAHGGVTFQVADLITTAVNKSPDSSNLKSSVGSTLVVALMSFAGDDDLRTSGKKIAAYAHLVALLLREKSFYTAVVSELKNHLPMLLGFIKLSHNHSPDEPSPWIPPILLVVELLLSEDARPRKTKWTPPKDENDFVEPPVLETVEPAVSSDERSQLLEAVLEILPRIGKDESLALSVLRILVILTRARPMAQVVGEKKNIQRLFVAAKQLAGASSARIQGPLMLILRHIIEDDDTVKQIIRSDIKMFFEQNRQPRGGLDVNSYLRGVAATAIRSPEFFIEITNEMVKFTKWSYANLETTGSRANVLTLKDPFAPGSAPTARGSEDSVQPTVQATEDLSLQDVKASTEETDSQMPDASKAAHPEHKLPVVENPDGVIHFLLCELLNYKDVDDKEPTSAAPAPSPTPQTTLSGADVNMTEAASTPSTEPSSPQEDKSKQSGKEEFKPEEHPIYIYRCFLLQCLTELLASYNRTKIEFINFKRSAPPQAMTPSKPRSSVVNYLLTDLIPIGTLDSSKSSVAYRKKTTTSSWADSVLVALLAKTGEQLVDKSREPSDGEDEPDLLFVRRFVLENILKAYKEASLSNEALETKYSRMLALAMLMTHIMNGKDTIGANDTPLGDRSHKQLRRVMFEKGFIGALTASIADVDLNFPGAKETVRQILKPLKVLTNTAIQLSDLSLISSTQAQAEDDGIESATSVSDMEDEREETPDLFRNSTLGMFEPDREEESSSESEDEDDEEMYDDGYGDEMEYEEDMDEDEEDNISEEDDEIDGIGHIEGLSGDHAVDVEVIMEEDDDDDDDEDDEDDEDTDDHEHDHGGSEDDEGRVEIIDELEENQHLGEEDDLDDWESDEGDDDEGDDEEEDYEAQAQDEDEVHIHQGLDVGSMVGGPLGDLVRALGGGEGAVDILERMEEQMEAEGLDAGDDDERLGTEYMEDGDGDEDEDEEEDMEDEEMFLEQGYPGGGPPGGFDWEGDVDPPMIISHRGHHRSRHAFAPPFPLLTRGDPLGGMSHPSRLPVFLQAPGGSSNGWRRHRLTPLETFIIIENETRRIARSRNDNDGTNSNAVPEYRPSYRSHRPPQPRSVDDGLNPLLQPSPSQRYLRDRYPLPGGADFMQALGPPGDSDLLDLARLGGPFGESPATAALFEILRSLPEFPGAIARNGPTGLSFHITGGHVLDMPPGLRAIIGGPRGARFEVRGDGNDSGNAAFFSPLSTAARWVEEAKLLFGPSYHEKASDLKPGLESVLVPPAIEADKALKAAELERLQKLEEEAKKKAEEERLAREAREEEEKIAKEKKEAEEREAAERAAEEARAARGGELDDMEDESMDGAHALGEAMDGVESEAGLAVEAEAEAAPAEDRPRVTTLIRGVPFDITDLGIDAEFLAELPEEIREEVIMNAVAERRSQAAATGAQPSEIDQEFLDALPEDIRDEIIQQERQDRRRREREEQRRQAAAAGGPAGAGEMDAASILATLPPALRQQVLMEQDEEMLSLLPQELADQARAAQRDHPAHARIGSGRRAPQIVGIDAGQVHGVQRPQRRSIVQMLDKSGIATLLRLMFTLQPDHLKTALWSVLENICMNRHNRTEVVSTILHILQDGSADMLAVERSFAQLSLRAKQQPKEKEQKTPLPLKRTHTGMSTSSGITSLIQANSEASPLLVVQQCLGTLNNLVGRNLHIPAFFLTEHDTTIGIKRTLSRKGKGKDNKASKYAINSLLNLLDRDLIMENSTVMELLSGLLNQITQPLQALQRKQKEIEAAKTEAVHPASEDAAPAASQENADQPSEEPGEAANIEVPPNAEGAEQPSTSDAPKPEEPSKEDKKQRPITPPVIPEYNLKLVINIFVARECSSRTFRETLSTIKNLSAIPGAKAVFGRELIAKAQGLGEVILGDLEALLPQIQKATTGTEIQGVALAKFSPGGSEQGKLLRVLTALDHLFDPKRDKKDKPDEESESSQISEKQDLLSTLYENSTFGPMWEKLSACLTVIRQRDHMQNVATILLPLIESLMVVCKNTTLKETPISRSQMGKEMSLTSPPPESRMESLFFTFTEDHRKILNDLVRNSPKLMSGTFSLLVKNPKVLEFDNKRNYFSRSIHTKSSTSRQSFPPLQLSVRREQVFHDSFKALYFQTADQMKFGKLSIRFHGEEGVDAGGVTREWFQVLSRQMFDPGYALFIPVSSDRTTFHPNQLSSVNEEHLMFFKFIGRIIGKALYEGRVLDCHFSRAVYKRILGKAVSLKDMESLDPDYYKSLVWMLENDITDIITETFSVDNDKFGVVETIEFIPNGRNIAVTEENKHEYVRLMVEWKLTGSVKEQLDEFLKGFHDIIPAELIAIFNEQELELLISGLPEIDVDDWKSNTEYHNYSASSSQIQWFWRAVRSFDKEERAKLLQFVTGTSKVPLNGFKELEGMNGFSRFNIHRDYGSKDRLPSSHTCFNQLDLPEYESYEALRQQVLTAITAGSQYFGFA